MGEVGNRLHKNVTRPSLFRRISWPYVMPLNCKNPSLLDGEYHEPKMYYVLTLYAGVLEAGIITDDEL